MNKQKQLKKEIKQELKEEIAWKIFRIILFLIITIGSLIGLRYELLNIQEYPMGILSSIGATFAIIIFSVITIIFFALLCEEFTFVGEDDE